MPHQSTTTITSTESPVTQDSIDSIKDPITKSIETISSLHIQESSNMTNHQQILESIALFFGQPTFLYLLLVLFAIWISDNFLAALVPFDLPEFRAQVYNDHVVNGQYLLIVDGTSHEILKAGELLEGRGIREWEIYGVDSSGKYVPSSEMRTPA